MKELKNIKIEIASENHIKYIDDINDAWDENLDADDASKEQEVQAEEDAREDEFAGPEGEMQQ